MTRPADPYPIRDKTKNDPVNPKHYADLGQYSAVIIIRFWNKWRASIGAPLIDFNVGNALKYIQRAGTKAGEPEIQDIKKAIWYLNSRIHDLDPSEPDPAG